MASTDNNDLPRSMKTLWTLLSGSLSLKSLQFIADELENSEHQLVEGILFYKPHDPKLNSLEELNKKKVSGIAPHILHSMSVFLDLEANQCYKLFQSYLLYEYKGTPEMAKSLFSTEKQIKDLFANLWYYYYTERIFTLFCFKQILSNWKTNEHSYSKIFQDFLKNLNADNQLLNKLMEQLKHLNNFDLESRAKYGPHFTEKFQIELRENILKEQSEILQLFLLYYKNFEPSIENVHELLKLFAESGFCPKVNSINNLDGFIGLLKALLIVESLDPNYLYKCHMDGIEHFILKPDNSNLISDVNSLILNLNTSTPEHSPIFLCWMIISVLENNDHSEHVERLGSTALELKIFKYFDRWLHSAQMVALKGSFIYNLVHEIIGNLLAVTFTAFDFEKLIQSEPVLSHLLIHLFSNDIIAKMVFESSLASGLGLSLRYALDLFPFQTHFLLNLLHALSQSNSCKSIYETMSILSTLTSYTEVYDASFSHFTSVDSDTFLLIEDKPVIQDCKIMLPKLTKGKLLHVHGNRLIKWNNISINGWRLLFYRLKYLINQIKQGQIYAAMLNDEVVLNEISTVAFICSELIAHNAHQNISHFKSIVNLLLDTFKLMVNFNHASIRLFMAGIIQLCTNIMKFNFLPADQIWFLLTEKKFFPYMIGFSTQLPEILAGTDTNISTLGYILSTDEFIKGNYELTFSFLDFILHCAKKDQFLNENSIIASFIFIIKDIFPAYKLWNYKNEQDATRIGRSCIDIFFHLLNRARKKSPTQLLQIEKICTILLMEGYSAEYLLHIIKNGEETIKTKILNSGNDSLLVKDNQIITVRTSLLILSYLLELYSQVSSTAEKSKSVIEEMLFSSTNNSNPNMLLLFTYFVYQKYDIYLATNAMQLLGQLAFKFPMSMLACFGANTESIRDHFLFRLETLTEDINFKISLLNFLSICVEHQPGLVEMFLNVDNNKGGVLSSILEILEEKLEGRYYCPFELHQASLRFVTKFWLRPNIIAINLLKKNDTFWKLITFPLFTKEKFNSSLCAYILKILSRELFYTKMLEKDTFNKELETLFTRIKSESIIEKLSAQIQQTITCSEPLEIDDNALTLIDAWKDFLSSWAMCKHLEADSLSSTVINSLLENISTLLTNNAGSKYTKIINKFSNLLLLISSNWNASTIKALKTDNFEENVVNLFSNVIQNKDVTSFSALVSLNTCLLKILLSSPEMGNSRLFQHVCHLLNNALQLINKQLNISGETEGLFLEKKLINVHLFIVILMLKNSKHDCVKYLDSMRKYEISELMFNLLIYLMHKNIHLDLAQNIPLYFVTVSSVAEGAEFLFRQNIVNSMAIYIRLPNQLFDSRKDDIELNYVCHIFSLLIRTVINMTVHLKHHFVESCISFIAIYSDSFREVCKSFRQTRKLKFASFILLTFELCSTLSKYLRVWQSSHEISLKVFAEEILLTCNSVIAFILQPTLLSHFGDEESSSQTAVLSSLSQLSSKSKALPTCSQNLLLQILLHSFKFILDISPNLFDLFEAQESRRDESHDLLLSTNFSLPNADPLEVLTFGSLVHFISYTIKSIYKLERETTVQLKQSKVQRINEDISLNISLLELSLTILLNQTLAVTNSAKINQMDKQIFLREINNEMNTITSNLSLKPQRRQNSISTLATPSPIKSTNINLMERQYIQLIVKLMDNVIQIQ